MAATAFGGLALATSIAVAAPAVGASPGIPRSTITTFGDRTAHYCVADYAPDSAVQVHNERNGATASIHTSNRGKGCTDVPVVVRCGKVETQLIVAAGVAADGNPGTSTARAAVPGGSPSCVGSVGAANGGSGGGSSVSVLEAVLLGVAAGCCVALGVIAVMLLRRRRAESVD